MKGKEDLAFCEWGFLPFLATRVFFHQPFSPPDLDLTPSQNISATKSFVGFQVWGVGGRTAMQHEEQKGLGVV